jgi:GH25 family lysozyme M1 (1,4-beta-N-acetylmuramidase)
VHSTSHEGDSGRRRLFRRVPRLAALAVAAGAVVATAAVVTLSPSAGAEPAASPRAQTPGIDVASHQGNVDWGAVAGAGIRWAFVKATEGTTYENPYFAQQYNGSYNAGMIRGAYHFALPDRSSGAAQANHFVDNGGGWSGDGKTLPGALDIEYNPYGATCYGLSAGQMVSWINDFVTTYRNRTGRDAVIYTTANWWNTCTGSNTSFAANHPIWAAHYGVSNPTLPAGWSVYTMWQYTSTGSVPGIGGNVDRNHFNGDESRLQALANG